jgi:hypothetical protein
MAFVYRDVPIQAIFVYVSSPTQIAGMWPGSSLMLDKKAKVSASLLDRQFQGVAGFWSMVLQERRAKGTEERCSLHLLCEAGSSNSDSFLYVDIKLKALYINF